MLLNHQIYSADVDPEVLDRQEVQVANQWYRDNGMIANVTKHQDVILGKTDYCSSFPVKVSLGIFGMNIDNKLKFDNHISTVCEMINKKFNVM